MSRRDRQTAEAFGDILDRDAQAEFGAGLDLSGALAANAKVSAAKLVTKSPVKATAPAAKLTGAVAVKAPAPKPAASVSVSVKAPAPKPTSSLVPAGMRAPTAAGLATAALLNQGATDPVKAAAIKAAAAKETASAGKSSAPAYPNVSQANFLDPGAGPIQSTVRAPQQTAAQVAASAKAVAANKAAAVKLAAQNTANVNAPYVAQRAADDKAARELDAHLLATDPEYAALRKASSEARTDWGLLPGGAAVLAAGAAIIATGGAAAGAIAAPSLATAAGAAVAADRALAAAEKAKIIKPGAAGVVGKALDAANKAQDVIATTQKLADAGVSGAIEGVKVIAKTAAERAINGAIAGVPQALTPEGAKAYDQYVAGAPELAAVLASAPAPAAGFAGASALAGRKAVAVTATTKRLALEPVVVWFVSAAGKVAAGKGSGAGWLVYSDGKVVKR